MFLYPSHNATYISTNEIVICDDEIDAENQKLNTHHSFLLLYLKFIFINNSASDHYNYYNNYNNNIA